MRSVELTKNIEIVDLGLYLSSYKTLILSDLHIGYEEALRKQGVLIPKFHFRDLVKRVEGIFNILKKEKKEVEIIIINGDLKHEFGKISDEEWRNTLKLLDWLGRKCSKILLVQGNHDKVLGPIADKRKVSLVDSVLLGDVMIVHGDKLVDVPAPVKTLIIGHEHAAVAVSDDLRSETFKCFLLGKYSHKTDGVRAKNVNLIVMPSMNPVVEGTDVLSEKLLSPFLKQDLSKFKAYIVGDEVYDFGKLESISHN